MDWYPFYYIAYKADTLNFSLAEDGAYRRLIDFYMETREPLPDNEASLCRIIGIGINEFRTVAEQVLSKFESIDGLLHNEKCNIELDRQDGLTKKRSIAGKKSAEKRNKIKTLPTGVEQVSNTCTDTGQDRTRQDKESKTLVVSKKDEDLKEFENWYKHYPKKTGPEDALKAYKQELKKPNVTHEDLFEGLKRYCKDIEKNGTERKYIKGPGSWIRTGRYKDDYAEIIHANSQHSNNDGGNIVEAGNRWLAKRAKQRDERDSDGLLIS